MKSLAHERERILYIDIARGIGIILVVLGHIRFSFYQLNFIYFFHMPLFFYLSGIFQKRRDWKTEIKRNSWVWLTVVVYGMFFIGIEILQSGSAESSKLLNLFFLTPIGIWEIPFFGVFWFLVALIVVRLLAKVFPPRWVFAGVGLYFVAYYSNVFTRGLLLALPFCIGPSLLLFGYFQAGSATHEIIKKRYSKTRLLVVAILYFCAFFSLVIYFDGDQQKLVNYHQMILFQPILSFFIAYLGIIFVLWLSIFIERTNLANTLAKFLSFIGQYSFNFFAWHLLTFMMFHVVVLKLFGNINPLFLQLGEFLAALAVGLAISLIQPRLANKLPRQLFRLIFLR